MPRVFPLALEIKTERESKLFDVTDNEINAFVEWEGEQKHKKSY